MSQNAVLEKTGDEKCMLEADQSSKSKDNNLSSKSTKNASGGNLPDFDVSRFALFVRDFTDTKYFEIMICFSREFVAFLFQSLLNMESV